jgi:outer membrane protein
MRLSVVPLTVCVALVAGSEARAQFANKSLGLQVGFLSLQGVAGNELDYGLPVGLNGSLYIENGFEATAQVGVIVAHDKILNSNILALDGPAIGIRYLFMEESVRPFAGLDLSYLQLFGTSEQPNTAFAGLGPNAGVDIFVTDSISIGLKVRFNIYVSLNEVWTTFGATLTAATYF